MLNIHIRKLLAIEYRLAANKEAATTKSSLNQYITMDFKRYAELKQRRLAASVSGVRRDLELGRYTVSTVLEHMEHVNR